MIVYIWLMNNTAAKYEAVIIEQYLPECEAEHRDRQGLNRYMVCSTTDINSETASRFLFDDRSVAITEAGLCSIECRRKHMMYVYAVQHQSGNELKFAPEQFELIAVAKPVRRAA